MCTREAGAIYDAGGLTCTLSFIKDYGFQIHKDTLHSAMSVVTRLCAKMEPNDPTLEQCVDSLSVLLQAEDTYVSCWCAIFLICWIGFPFLLYTINFNFLQIL